MRLAGQRRGLREIDRRLEHLMQAGLGPAFATYCGMCVVEALEAFWILRLVGSRLGFASVMPMDAILTWLRAAAFFVPGGLSIQDLGAVTFLHVVGLPDAAVIGASYVILKRAKEAFWIATGYLLLARTRPVRVAA